MSHRRFREDLTWEEKARCNPLFADTSVPGFDGDERVPSPEDLDAFFADDRRKRIVTYGLSTILPYPSVPGWG